LDLGKNLFGYDNLDDTQGTDSCLRSSWFLALVTSDLKVEDESPGAASPWGEI